MSLILDVTTPNLSVVKPPKSVTKKKLRIKSTASFPVRCLAEETTVRSLLLIRSAGHGLDDDASVVGMLSVKANEVLTVVGDDGTLVRSCEAQHLVIRDGRVGIAGIERGEHVMAANAEGGDDREWEILV